MATVETSNARIETSESCPDKGIDERKETSNDIVDDIVYSRVG